ncbi:prolyl 3-hydroxylase sudestada1-like isoform X2 [Toxorhynchites rutilus septentrionalis]|uniref:prolyl 3-hydroxylase sudestada1-like isoform X2 n=1 Tax=Toxorhynchites rutilus septentrionalis TaxID=329112 RepID=UPI00247914A1|nr:prolyl 3-hydroxylase sudestada1-like isoform X2 [Toxorhynchites rutilus septentrionalis]
MESGNTEASDKSSVAAVTEKENAMDNGDPATESHTHSNGKSSDLQEVIKRPAQDILEISLNKVPKLEGIIKMNRRYHEEEFRRQFKQSWSQKEPFRGNGYKLKSEPFQLAVLEEFLEENTKTTDVTRELEREFSEMDWRRKQMDLYEFYQTADLCMVEKRFLASFYSNLKENVLPLVQELTGIPLTHVSASCSMYNAGDYLLVHDDLLTDRRIAYVFYLSPWEEHRKWSSNHGGALELFKADENMLPVFPVTNQIYPQNNQLVFFKVSEKSFHQVGEVTTFDYPRLTINGWFHGPQGEETAPHTSIIVDTHFFSPETEDVQLTEWINNVYLIDEVKQNVQKKVEMFSEVSLEEFLTPEIFEVMCDTLQSNNNAFVWTIKGPAHLRKYEVLDFSTIKTGPLRDLYKLFVSKDMFQLLHEYTELDLAGDNAKTPACSLELQRWQKGCYTVLGDTSSYTDGALDILIYLNAQDNVGIVTYLEPEGEPHPSSNSDDMDEDDPVLLTVYPKDNVLNVVYRAEGTTKFTKYVSRNVYLEQERTSGGHPYTYILACSYKE